MNDISYQQYLQEINEYPLLRIEEENELARIIKIRNRSDNITPQISKDAEEAISKLVVANLRLVIKIVNGLVKRASDKMDLISEGNRGLMRAAETFDPEKGAKFSVYSSFWVKQYINKYIYKNGDLFKLPDKVWSNKYKVMYYTEEYEQKYGCKPSNEIIAEALSISVNAVMNVQDMDRQVVHLDATMLEGGDSSNEEIVITDTDKTPDNYFMSQEAEEIIQELLNDLPSRERDIIIRRYGLNGHKQDTLFDIGSDYKLTQERIRQLENNCIVIMRTKLSNRDIEENPIGAAFI